MAASVGLLEVGDGEADVVLKGVHVFVTEEPQQPATAKTALWGKCDTRNEPP
jgi:hypothetical protein